jgi:glycogen debranching enzyme
MPIPEFGDDNHVILSSFDETVIQHGAEFNMGLHKYENENYSPKGHKYIREYKCDTVPRTMYRVGGVILSKEKVFSMYENRILIKYTLEDAHSATTLRFRPFLAFRKANELTQANENINRSYAEIPNGIKMCLYPGYPE